MALKEGSFKNSSGMNFYYRSNWPEGEASAVVVGVHGFAEHSGRYAELESFLNSKGCAFYMMDNRAHGRSGGKKAHIDDYDEFISDLREFIATVKPEFGGRKVFLLGHSNGSLISIRYLLKYQDEFDGAILSGAALRAAVPVPAIKLKLMPVLAKLLPKTMFNAGLDANGLSHDKKVVKDYLDDPLVYKIISAKFAFEMFKAMEDSLARAAEIRLPVIMLHGGSDPACDPAAAKDFFERLSSKDKTMRTYPGLFHEVFNEIEKDKVFADLVKWLEPRIK